MCEKCDAIVGNNLHSSNEDLSEHVVTFDRVTQPHLTGTLLRRLIVALLSSSEIKISILTIRDACIGEPLDLRGFATKSAVIFDHCSLQELLLSDASLRSMHIYGGNVTSVIATRITLTGSFDLNIKNSRALSSANDPHPCSTAQGVELSGATVGGNVDLRGNLLKGFTSESGYAEESETVALRADGLTVYGSVLLSDGFCAEGEVRLNGCTINRNLDLSQSRLRYNKGYALSVAGSTIKGNIRFSRRDWQASDDARSADTIICGSIRVSNAKIGGGLDLSGVHCRATSKPTWDQHDIRPPKPTPDGHYYAIDAHGISVGGTVRLDNVLAEGPLNFVGSTLSGGITGRRLVLDFPSGHALLADSATVNGSVHLDGIVTSGVLRFNQCELKGGLYIKNPKFIPSNQTPHSSQYVFPRRLGNWRGPMCGVTADRAIITGGFEVDEAQVIKESVLRANAKSDIDIERISSTETAKELLSRESSELSEAQEPEDRAFVADLRAHLDSPIQQAGSTENTQPSWNGVTTRFTLDGARLGGINNDALHSLSQFDAVHLMNCNYGSLITHELPVDRPSSQSGGLRTGSTPNVNLWLDVLDSVYAPEAKKRGLLGKWEQTSDKKGLRWMFKGNPNGLRSGGLLIVLFEFALSFLRHLLVTIGKGLPNRAQVPRELEHLQEPPNNNASSRLNVRIFHPQPYMQLARTMRDAGFERHAEDIIKAMEWRRTWYGDLTQQGKIWQVTKGFLLDFGFSRWRPLLMLLTLAFFSAAYFQYSYEVGVIVPSKANQVDNALLTPDFVNADGTQSDAQTLNAPQADLRYRGTNGYVRFNGLLFALDAIIPLTDLGQRKNWIIEPVAGTEYQIIDERNSKAIYSSKSTNDKKQYIPPKLLAIYFYNLAKMLSYQVVAILYLIDVICGSLLTGIFLAGVSGMITSRY